jgi:hypothetical protein
MLWATALPEAAAMTGSELIAGSIALERFRKEESNSDVANFMVEITERSDAFEVVFVPKMPPYDTKRPNITIGGGNIYGREVHYVVAKGTFEILRTSFGR